MKTRYHIVKSVDYDFSVYWRGNNKDKGIEEVKRLAIADADYNDNWHLRGYDKTKKGGPLVILFETNKEKEQKNEN